MEAEALRAWGEGPIEQARQSEHRGRDRRRIWHDPATLEVPGSWRTYWYSDAPVVRVILLAA